MIPFGKSLSLSADPNYNRFFSVTAAISFRNSGRKEDRLSGFAVETYLRWKFTAVLQCIFYFNVAKEAGKSTRPPCEAWRDCP